MNGEIIKQNRSLGISIERGTARVPDDNRYHVIVDNEIVYSTKVLAAAEVYYEEQREARSEQARARLAAERAHYDMQAVRSDAFARRAANARKKGGRGGRGGV